MKVPSIAWALVAWIACCSLSFAQPVLRFARIENIPDQYVGGEILKVVYSRLNISIELVDMPAQRALNDSSSGRIDGEVQRNINVQKQYPTLIMLRPAINYIEPSVFSRKQHFRVKGWDSIRGYHVGIVRGVGTSEDGTRGMPSVLAVTSLDQLMQALAADRVDVAVSDAFSARLSIKKQGLTGIAELSPPLQRTEIYHFLNEKHRALVPKVEKMLRTMQASGELEALRRDIMAKYEASVPAGAGERRAND